ncbi:hypothetical protein GW17_00014766 [Ensete ventricosum]|nr:hypothetical protein GW17_00014766 [Ensete ventricosum]RZS09704.1 hypothetical protein BHM03_00040817 [Ensete ventricosum]
MRSRTLMYSISDKKKKKKKKRMMMEEEKKKLYSTSNEYMRSAFCHENVPSGDFAKEKPELGDGKRRTEGRTRAEESFLSLGPVLGGWYSVLLPPEAPETNLFVHLAS